MARNIVTAGALSCLIGLAFPTNVLGIPGDADGNGVVDIEDARIIARFLVNQVPAIPNPADADATEDGMVDMEDAYAIAKHVTGQSRIIVVAPRYGRPDTLHVGEMIRIEVFEHFFPLGISDGTVRITSVSTGYDSGVQPLTPEQNGRSLFYHWDTLGLDAAPDYEITLTVASGQDVLTVLLMDRRYELRVLAANTDAYCPAPGMPLRFRRVAPHDSANYPYLGPLGFGWFHNYDISLTEFTDGRVAFHGPEGSNRFFESNPDGTYSSAPGDYGVLTIEPDGTFQLREKDGFIYRFRPDLRFDYEEDLNGNRITAIYDASNRLVAISHSCGKSFSLAYDDVGRITQLTDHAGRVTTYQYDTTNQLLTSVTAPMGVTTEYNYTLGQGAALDHRLTSIAFPDGTETHYQYDAEARVTQRTGKSGLVPIAYTYDPDGTTHVIDALGNDTAIRVNEHGAPTEIRDPLGATTFYAYDAANNLIQVTDPLGHSYSYEYDAYGNMTRIIDPLSNTIDLAYDLRFHKIALLHNARGNTTTFAYDDAGNLLTTTYPDGSTEQYTYDGNGHVASKTNRRGQTITYSYNTQGQLLAKGFPDGTSATYAYDGSGNMTLAANDITTITMAYDQINRLTRVEYSGGFFFDYEYDAAGKRTRRMDQDGRQLNYEYDAVGRLLRIEDETATAIVRYAYGPAGRLIAKTLANGVHTSYIYNAAGHVLQITNFDPANAVLSRFEYAYDAIGNRVSMTSEEGLHTYTYDALGRLTQVQYPDGRHFVYQHDSAGNRVNVTDDGSSTLYVTNNLDQYMSAGAATFTYDSDGNLATKTDGLETNTFRYDADNHLRQIETSAHTWTYAYDPFGRRIQCIKDGVRTNYVVEVVGPSRVVSECDESGNIITTYVHGYGLIARTDNMGPVSYYTFDALGSTSEITDSSGVPLNVYRYGAFGEWITISEGIPNEFRYVGEYGVMNEENGLLLMRSRFYDPRLGRFLSIDPVGLQGGDMNLYRYCSGNPVTFIDPTGYIKIWGLEFDWRAFVETVLGGDVKTITDAEEARVRLNKLRDEIKDIVDLRDRLIEDPNAPFDVEGATQCPTFIQSPSDESSRKKPGSDMKFSGKGLEARIIIPVREALVRSDIPIYGVASGTGFDRYRVEYGMGRNPPMWLLMKESEQPQEASGFGDVSWMQGDLDLHGNLATWNVGLKNWSHLPWHPPEDPTDLNGVYTIRLVVEGKDGNTVEDRVTCEVGRVIAQCLPGIAISPDERVVMRFPEQALTHPFRVHTILPLSEVGEETPRPPEGARIVGPVYRIREPGDRFAKDVTLEFSPTAEEAESLPAKHIGLCQYDAVGKKWTWLETGRDEAGATFSTVLTELPTPKAIYALAYDPVTERSALKVPAAPPEPAEAVRPGVLVDCSFEDDLCSFAHRDRFVGARVSRTKEATPDSSYCLKLTNENQGGNFSCTVLDRPFDLAEYPTMAFDYRIAPDVRIDFLLKVNGRWERVRFTGKPIDFLFQDVNIEDAGEISGVVADDRWHTATVDLRSLLRRNTRHTRIDEIVMADWDVGGYMKLAFGRNRRGATVYLDNFRILGGEQATEAPHVLTVDDFDERKGVNHLGGVSGDYGTPGADYFGSSITSITSENGPEGSKAVSATSAGGGDAELRLSFDMRPIDAYGGYWTSLRAKDLSDYSSLHFQLRTESPVPPMHVGIKNIGGVEGKTLVAPYATTTGEDGLWDVDVPLGSLKGLPDAPAADALFFAFSHRDRSGQGQVWVDDVRFERSPRPLVADFETQFGWNRLGGDYGTDQSGAAAISASVMPDTTQGHRAKNHVCRISFGGNIGHDYGAQGGFSYCAWRCGLKGIDARLFTRLTLRIRGEQGGETPNIYVADSVKRIPMRASELPPITQEWQRFELPLDHYAEQGIDLSRLERLEMVFEWTEQSGTVYVDDVAFD